MKSKEKYLLYSSNLWNLGSGLMGPFLALFSQSLGGDVSQISFVYAIYMFITGFLTIYIGKISDKKYSKEFLCFLGYFLNLTATFLQIFVSSIYSLFLLEIIFGIGLAFSNSTWKDLFEANNTKGKEGNNWGIAFGELNIMLGIATILGGLILKFTNFKTLFLLMSLIQLVATYFQYKVWTKKAT